MDAFLGPLQSGILYAVMALGVYLTFRILDFPDLTVDASFTTGAGIAAIAISNGISPILATLFAFVGGALGGAITGILHTKGKINSLLSGIIMMIALYSINLRIMGKSNYSLLGIDTLFSQISNVWVMLFITLAMVIVLKVLLDWFLHTEIGLALRATGDNSKMIRSFGVNTDGTIILGVSLSNGIVALSGALVAQSQGFADITMGVGMIVIGLASVIIGESIFGAKTVIRATLAVVLGAIIYRIIIALALRIEWLQPSDMKLITAVIVIIALTVPMFQRSMRQKHVAKKRGQELLEASKYKAKGGVS
ncbi:ABC transporter permease [Paenibacillus albiflavus]|uniref:ABC transporter permease n=1 Tax=Paenibacillus albiflavus TaxID=2545760 RepID=A0A4R4EG82_9BACL|nr:ABC transporter permease [Paenibacillus albiflavus]